jgi:hypothetical protein
VHLHYALNIASITAVQRCAHTISFDGLYRATLLFAFLLHLCLCLRTTTGLLNCCHLRHVAPIRPKVRRLVFPLVKVHDDRFVIPPYLWNHQRARPSTIWCKTTKVTASGDAVKNKDQHSATTDSRLLTDSRVPHGPHLVLRVGYAPASRSVGIYVEPRQRLPIPIFKHARAETPYK